MVNELKALTHINLPFIEERFAPGDMIPVEKIEAYAEAARAAVDDRTHLDEGASPPATAEGVIAEMIKWGSLSEDPDADIHPDNVIPDANALSLQSVRAAAITLADQLEAAGKEVPPEIQAIADAYRDAQYVTDQDEGLGADTNA